jgi:DNA processing protein
MVQPGDILFLSQIPGVGSNRLRTLVNHFHNPADIRHATARELCSVDGIEAGTARSILRFFREGHATATQRFVDDQLRRCERCNAMPITLWDSRYPDNLKKIYDPPPLLFVRGTLSPGDRFAVAMVGTRAPSPYGTRMAVRFAEGLAGLGIPVVSGLARGIDTIAHEATLRCGGRTLAVIGSGIDVIYPSENRALAARIAMHGAVVSEFVMGTKPDPGNFPRRNRIISGIALGTVVVETGIQGGAMITAGTALDQNREVFALPSAITEKPASGTNHLIREGKALLIESVDDIIAELSPRLKGLLSADAPVREDALQLTLFEQQVYDAVTEDPVHIDQIAERAGIAIADALVHLLALEFKGAVRQLRGKLFTRI